MFRKTLMILALLCAVTHGVFAQRRATHKKTICREAERLYLGDDNQMYYPSTAMPVNAFRAYLILQGEREFGNPSSTE